MAKLLKIETLIFFFVTKDLFSNKIQTWISVKKIKSPWRKLYTTQNSDAGQLDRKRKNYEAFSWAFFFQGMSISNSIVDRINWTQSNWSIESIKLNRSHSKHWSLRLSSIGFDRVRLIRKSNFSIDIPWIVGLTFSRSWKKRIWVYEALKNWHFLGLFIDLILYY